jgi:PAS domain S-box-containing protein
MFEKNPLPVLIINPQNGLIVDANPQAVEYLGWTYEEIISKELFEINTLPQVELLKNLQAEARLKSNKIIQQYVLKTGEVRDVEIYNCPIELCFR